MRMTFLMLSLLATSSLVAQIGVDYVYNAGSPSRGGYFRTKGLFSASSPRVVAGPCPGMTRVAPSST